MNKNIVVQPEGNYFDKYHSKNFIVKWMMSNFFSCLDNMLAVVGEPEYILEAGCGEGEVTNFVSGKYGANCKMEAFDVSERVIMEASKKNPNIKFSTGDIYNISGQGGYDLVLCCEVLEHLKEPDKALEELIRVAKKYIIVSVPREPIWRCLNMARGKYLKAWGNTPGHIQHWSSKKFVTFLQEHTIKVVQTAHPLPWTMALLEKE